MLIRDEVRPQTNGEQHGAAPLLGAAGSAPAISLERLAPDDPVGAETWSGLERKDRRDRFNPRTRSIGPGSNRFACGADRSILRPEESVGRSRMRKIPWQYRQTAQIPKA
ncbi:hypothetical protein [Sphingomonas sp. UYP23]